jgi:hypothetical protein
VLQVIILLEDNTQFPGSPQIKVLQGPKIVVIKDLDVVWPAHDTLNSVKSSHALSGDASPYYQVASTMLDVFLGKMSIQGLFRLNPAILVAI